MNTEQIVRRLAAMRAARIPVERAWQECFDYTFPERGSGLNGAKLTPEGVQSSRVRILDDTAVDAARLLSASLVSGTTPANSIWFGLDAGLDSSVYGQASEEARWLDDAARVIFENIHQSNFDAAAYECCIDLVPAGWFVMYITEQPGGGYTFEQWPIAQCFVSASKPGRPVDTIFREVELTVEQLVAEYGIDKVSGKTAERFRQQKFDEPVRVCHAIYPRALHAVGAKMARNLPFASMHVELDAKHLLRESGYHEFPCAVPRWMLVPGSAYATGPVSNALGSIRTVNDIKRQELANLDLATSGMWIAEDDGVLNPRAVKIGPRKIIVANSVDSMKALQPATSFDVVFASEERLQASIRKLLLADQLQPQDGPAMTATEVHIRVGLIRQLLGPIYGRLQSEYLQPLVERCFGLAYRAGILGAAPESMQGRAFSVKFISPLARAQRLEEVSAIDQYVAGAVQAAQASPEVLDTVDFDEAQKVRGTALGVPQSIMRQGRKLDEYRQRRADAAQQAQQDQAQQEMLVRAAPGVAAKFADKVAA